MKIKFRVWDRGFSKLIYEVKAGNLFTGFLDKNGKEIYVGDICKGSWGRYKDADVVELDEIIYANYECVLGDLEVIGNIYENPELITQ
jgi:hypothetical protein